MGGYEIDGVLAAGGNYEPKTQVAYCACGNKLIILEVETAKLNAFIHILRTSRIYQLDPTTLIIERCMN
jgi:hypothetical protein